MRSYTVKEVADLIQVNPETVRRWIRGKKLRAEKTSNKGGNKILESELRAFLKVAPAYATGTGALLVLGVAAPAVMLSTFAMGKAIEANDLKKTNIDSKVVIGFIQSEISSHEALVKRKKESIRQIEKEITAEQDRIKELRALIEGIKNTQSNDEGENENG